MRKHVLLGSAAVLVALSCGATAQTSSKEQTNRSTTAPAAQSTAPTATTPSSGPSAQGGTTSSGPAAGTASGQNSPSGPAATSNPSRGTASQTAPQASPPSSSSSTTSQPPAASATGSTTAPNSTQNSGTAQRNNAQTPSGQAPSGSATQSQQTAPQTPSTQQQATQPNTNAGAQTQQATQPGGAAQQQNAQRNQAPGGVVSLNVQQRTQIGQTIARHNVKPVRNVNFSIAVGTAVPRSIQLRALPTDLVTFVPQYRGYSYFVVEEQIVIVEPSSTQIIAVIPYSGGTATRAAAPAPTKSRAVKLSTQEREVIRRHTSERRSSDAPARKASRRYSVGDEVETTEIIETFPETVYREAPSVRRYRYLRQDDNVILVDPDDHRVVDVFD